MLELDVDGVGAAAGLLALSPLETRLLGPDHPFLRVGRWRGFVLDRDGSLVARVIASIDPRQGDRAGPVGCIGFVRLGASDAPDAFRSWAAQQVLVAAMGWLRSEGVATIRCPVQFSTWYGHRAVTGDLPDVGGAQPFVMEPLADRTFLELLGSSGFAPAHRAVSCLVDSAAVIDQTGRVLARLRAAGIRDRAFSLAGLDEDLHLLRSLSMEIFRGSWGLSDISFDEFASIYGPLAGTVDPELIRILETRDGRAIGFALGLDASPDSSLDRGAARAFVVKTLGVTADARRRHPGVGAGLVGLIHRIAWDRGYAAGIHALMATDSVAHRLSLRWGKPIRSYTTFDRRAP